MLIPRPMVIFVAFIEIILPILFLIWLWKATYKSKASWWISAGLVAIYFVTIVSIPNWDWFSNYTRYIFLILLVFVVGLKFSLQRKSLPFSHTIRGIKDWTTFSLRIALVIFLVIINVLALQEHFYTVRPVELAFPLKSGIFYVANGGNGPLLNNHSTSAGRYAIDIVELNSWGMSASGIEPAELTRYAIYGENIYSPCDGQVTGLRDSLPDLIPPQRDRINLAGNYVQITCKGVDVILAHMMPGSILVNQGEMVSEGQPIGRVGNSENSGGPHLHIHAVITGSEDPNLFGEGVPILFMGRFLVTNDIVGKR